jgi:hypothetical protein
MQSVFNPTFLLSVSCLASPHGSGFLVGGIEVLMLCVDAAVCLSRQSGLIVRVCVLMISVD